MVHLHKNKRVELTPGRTGLNGPPARRAFTNESDDVTTIKKEELLTELPMTFVADTTRNTEVARVEPLVSTGTVQTTTEQISKQKITTLAIDGISSRKKITICQPIRSTTISAEIQMMLIDLGAMSTAQLNSAKSRLAMKLKR